MTGDSDEAYKRGQRDTKIAALEASHKDSRSDLEALEKRQRKTDLALYTMGGIIATVSAKVTGLIEIITGGLSR